MISSEAQDIVSADTAGHGDDDNLKFVPVSESIRYRKRAQSAEKKIESLAEQLAEAKAEVEKTAEQLKSIQVEQKLVRELAAAGAVDLETAVLIARARVEGEAEADIDNVIRQLKKEKQYLFAGVGRAVTATKTAGAKERTEGSHTVLERAAKKAATTGSRTDLQEYLKMRRNFI
ncbi:MAG: hypothetical protein GWN67_04485 [Phycisphaerae bacterium]|nr:hypothetical protein [Phycisphaerae bacterium]NIP51180.1 hypothetical protein [Phycisphaerae bacterium]NIS50391.1 hypothetical protein [Phycisphaerae bacterium]NIU08121.1 hypothetical protein [Phycisphaerae bacterium]NIU55664.1 hypothetical protein [Phycisphaerae bacterium]